MSTPAPDSVLTLPRGTVGFERKVQVKPYETATASIHIQFEVDPENEANTVNAAKDAFFQAQAVVLEQLGIAFEYDKEKGVVKELLTAQFGPVTEVESAPPQNGSRPSARAAAASDDPRCPQCNGPMWDNRATKTNPKAPDFRCKDKVCGDDGGVIWPPKKGGR